MVGAAVVLTACGGGGGSSGGSTPPPPPPPVNQSQIGLYAGMIDYTGDVDNPALQAQFNFGNTPGMVADQSGNLYVADNQNYTIRMVASTANPVVAGNVVTIAGGSGIPGSIDGLGTNARFAGPQMIAMDAAGNLYVTDQGAQSSSAVVRKITPGNMVTTLTNNATGVAIQTSGADAIAVDSSSNLYIFTAQPTDPSALTQVTPAGVVIPLTLKLSNGTPVELVNPQGLAVDAANNIYITDDDVQGNAGILYKVTLSGSTGIVTPLAGTLATSGSSDGVGAAATFDGLGAIALDPVGNIYVNDFWNDTIREVSSSGTVTTLAGVAGQWGLNVGATLPGTLPDTGSLVWFGNTLYGGDIDDNVIYTISQVGS